MESCRAPQPPGHVSALINPPHYGSKYALIPRTSYPPPPHLSDTLSTKHPPPTGQKSACGPPPRIISGTALRPTAGMTAGTWMITDIESVSLVKTKPNVPLWGQCHCYLVTDLACKTASWKKLISTPSINIAWNAPTERHPPKGFQGSK